MLNKKGGVVSFILLLLFILLCFFVLIYYFEWRFDRDCLEETAKEVCEDRGYFYNGLVFDLSPSISCKSNERSTDYIKYNFLTKELEECKR